RGAEFFCVGRAGGVSRGRHVTGTRRSTKESLPPEDVKIMVPPPEPALVSGKRRLRDVAKDGIYIAEGGGAGPVFQRVKIELITAALPVEATRIEAAERQLPSLLEGHLAMGRVHHDPARRDRLKNPAQPRPE